MKGEPMAERMVSVSLGNSIEQIQKLMDIYKAAGEWGKFNFAVRARDNLRISKTAIDDIIEMERKSHMTMGPYSET